MSQLKKVVIKFPLPFVLLLPDSIEKGSSPEGYEDFVLAKDRIPVMLRFKKEVREHPPNIGVATMDTKGVLSYSLVEVWFDNRYFEKFGVSDDFRQSRDMFIDSSIMYLNRFLDIYRDTTDFYWINTINRINIPYFQIFGIFMDGTQDSMVRGSLGTGVGLGTPIDYDGLRERNKIGYIPDKIQHLVYKVLSSMDEGDYWSAALLSEIIFEAKVTRILRMSFTSTELTEDDIDGKFQNTKGAPLSITGLLIKHIFQRFEIDEKGDTAIAKEYQKWYNTARAIRNDIAHGKILMVSKEQAEESIESVKQFLSEIGKLLPDKYPTRINYIHRNPGTSCPVSGMVYEFTML